MIFRQQHGRRRGVITDGSIGDGSLTGEFLLRAVRTARATLLPCLALLLVPFSAPALQLREGHDNGVITASISAEEVNRLSLRYDRVRLASAPPEVSITHDSKSGAVYFRLTNPENTKPVNLFVETEKGFTYQLLLMAEHIPSEQIIIHNPVLMKARPEAKAFERKSPYAATLSALVRALAVQETPPGYAWASLNAPAEKKEGLRLRTKSVLQGAALQGHVIEVENAGAVEAVLHEALFYDGAGTLAVWIPKRTLAAGSVTRIYRVAESGGQP